MSNITDKVKTFEDACKILGIQDLNLFMDLPSYMDEFVEFNIVSIKLQVIIRALNEGWKPDWNNKQERKYYPWFYMDSFRLDGVYGPDDYSSVAFRFVFKNEELAKYCATQFHNLWKIYMLNGSK